MGTIHQRTNRKGKSKSYRALIRLKGAKPLSATFSRLTDARDKNATTRNIVTTLPATWHTSQFHDSWIALLVSSVEKLDESLVRILRISIRNMSSYYTMYDPASVQAAAGIPRNSFIEATTGDSSEPELDYNHSRST